MNVKGINQTGTTGASFLNLCLSVHDHSSGCLHIKPSLFWCFFSPRGEKQRRTSSNSRSGSRCASPHRSTSREEIAGAAFRKPTEVSSHSEHRVQGEEADGAPILPVMPPLIPLLGCFSFPKRRFTEFIKIFPRNKRFRHRRTVHGAPPTT